MSTTVIDTLSWCKHNVFASSMMQMQCICIIMTILESSSLMFTTSIQVYNTMSFVFVHRSRWHTLCFQVHWSSRVAGPAERPGIHKVHGLLGQSQLRHSSQPWWGCGPTNGRRCSTHPGSAQSVQPLAGAWTRNPPRCTHGTIYLGTASIEDADVPCE